MTMLSTISYSTTPSGLLRRAVLLPARLRRRLITWLAAALAWRERRAALLALRQWDDRELKDIGLYRGQIAEAIDGASRRRLPRGW
jgi:uncharacterized protein YjiS (DUF1127 family)